MEPSQESHRLIEQFPNLWQASTADSNLTLHGFRRFKTTHLLNLRYIEAEIAEIDHTIYQLGLSSNVAPSSTDRLGLKHCKRDEIPPSADQTLSKELLQRLRQLLKDYDDAIIAFNTIMSMDTFALLDDEKSSSFRTDLTLYEMYKTRLLRLDQLPRTRQDHLQRWIHQRLRDSQYSRMSRSTQGDVESTASTAADRQWYSQNTALIADVVSRIILGVVTAIFLIAPLVALSYESRKGIQIVIVSVFVVVFACLVSAALKASSLEMMLASAAYAAIISVFVSNSPEPG
ncbi:hypothetical protein HDV57DRAFT_498423 [Trichoderma longibrachiatum]